MMTLEEKFETRVNELKKAIPKLKKENQEIALQFVRNLSRVKESKRISDCNEKFKLLLFNGNRQLNEIFSGNRVELISFFFGNENAKRFEKLWNRLTIATYQNGWYRRSFRTKIRTALYFEKGLDLINAFFKSTAIDFNLEKYLNIYIKSPHKNYFDTQAKDAFEENVCRQITASILIQNIIALDLDENDQFVTNRIKEVIYGENSSGILTKEIIRGILISRNEEAHQWVGNLLLATKLQEGLRQTIVEACDECSIEGFRYIIKIILDNNLERFSSIVRAIGSWMGLQTAEFRPNTIRKTLEIAADIISNKANIDQLLDSDDLIEIYVALWGIGLREIADTKKPLLDLIKSKKKYKQLAALHFLQQTNDHQLMKEVVFEMLDENDPELWIQLAAMTDLVLADEWRIRRIEILQNKINNQEENSDNDDDDIDLDSYCRYNISFGQYRTNNSEIRKIFVRLSQLAESTSKKVTRFEPDAFNEGIRRLSANNFIRPMISCVVLLGSNDNDVQLLLPLIPKMDAHIKVHFAALILTLDNPLHRKALIDLFCDPHLGRYHDHITQKLNNIVLTLEEYETLENTLRLKNAEIRLAIIKLLLKQPPKELQKSIERLLNSKEEQKRLAGLDLIDQAEKLSKFEKKYTTVVSACKQTALTLAEKEKEKGTKKSTTEEILVQKIAKNEIIKYTRENGFGLCDPNGKPNIPEPKKSKTLLADIFISEMPRLEKILIALDNLIHEYRDYEYTGYYHFTETAVTTMLGTSESLLFVNSLEEHKKKYGYIADEKLEDYILADVWQEFYAEQKLTTKDIILLYIFVQVITSNNFEEFESFCDGKGVYEKYVPDFTSWFNSACWHHKKMKPYGENISDKIRYNKIVYHLTEIFYCDLSDNEKADFFIDILSGIYHSTSKKLFTPPFSSIRDNLGKVNKFNSTLFSDSVPPFKIPLDFCRENAIDSTQFEYLFNMLYKFYEASNYNRVIAPSIEILEKARSLNLIDDEELLREIVTRDSCIENFQTIIQSVSPHSNFRHVFVANKMEQPQYPHFKRLLPKVIDRILEIEIQRGDSPSGVSYMAIMIEHFEGIEYFVKILKAMDKTPFTRGYILLYDKSRSTVFSSLLRACEPEENADSTLFADIPEQRLLEAAMYAPQWIDLVQEFLGWEGLISACWYFHA
ncbi:MAG: DUF5724 domain-containing protein, partial [Planctomycetaceae bacterium]|nr:DUF5724 domain-containing protein [Planctomycetaceae bacterium]